MAEKEWRISLAGMPLRDVKAEPEPEPGPEPEDSGDAPPPGDQPDSANDDWDTDLELDDINMRRAGVSDAELYLRACEVVGVVPATYYLRHLGSATLDMSHRSLGPKGAKALAIALVCYYDDEVLSASSQQLASQPRSRTLPELADDTEDKNYIISVLELEDNCILAEGARYLMEMLKENCSIQRMNLSNNNLQAAGAKNIAKMLVDDNSIKSLALSANGFLDEAAKYFADALASNFQVKSLDLSHNCFCETGGEHLGHMLASNESLKTLNLSWNFLRMSGAVALCSGLKVNITLKHLDLSYNGFGSEGAQALGDALRHNNTLLSLDLSSNRVTDEATRLLCHGLGSNDTLRALRGAFLLLNTVKNNPKSGLEDINISTVVVSEAFVELLESMRQDQPVLEVQHNGVAGYFSRSRKTDPMKVQFLEERKQSLAEFFRRIDKDGTMRVHASELKKAIQQAKMPLDCFNIEVFIQKLGVDKTGMIDYR
ncbi:hypothetical protein ACEWY4_021640 [Coilia grayii]|uniref:EF-hand domain-containing protein n=1 Tax=Coilia grayii TaxID=363190 RepID=A0ABD1J3X6_9TELE